MPAGKYAKQYLDDQHLYGDVKDKIIFAKDVKQVLNYVEKCTGRIRLQNRLISTKEKANKVKVIEEIKLSKPITYKAGATSDKN